MTRLRLPGPSALSAEPPLAPVLMLEIACVLAATALRAWHPSILTSYSPGEDDEISAARALFDDCGHLRDVIDEYRLLISARLGGFNSDWPD